MNTQSQKIRLFIVDDHPLIRDGLRMLLAKMPDIEVIGEAASAESAWDQIQKQRPDVALVDLSLPDHNGVWLLDRIKTSLIGVRTLVLSMHNDAEYVVKAQAAGALGYVLKSAPAEELIDAIQSAFNGSVYLSTALKDSPREHASHAPISPREKEVLKLVAAGCSAKEIADALKISPRTVESHRNNLMRKLEAKNAAELIRVAISVGIDL